jgi:hypothetical protein
MRLATLAVGVCAAIALGAAPFEAGAKGGKGAGHGYGYTSVFVGTSFVLWPRAYYWPDYYPAAVPAVEYWYYCQPYAAYYPYVQECPTEWQPVLPTAPSPES